MRRRLRQVKGAESVFEATERAPSVYEALLEAVVEESWRRGEVCGASNAAAVQCSDVWTRFGSNGWHCSCAGKQVGFDMIQVVQRTLAAS